MARKRIRISREQENPTDKLNMAAIRSEVARHTRALLDRIEKLETVNAALREQVSKQDIALTAISNAATIAMCSGGSTRVTVIEFLQAIASSLVSPVDPDIVVEDPYSLEPFSSIEAVTRTGRIPMRSSDSPIRWVSREQNPFEEDEPGDYEDDNEGEDIISNVSED
jgi:hypothetical protein